MDANVEKDCSLLEELFQHIISDLKNSFPVWEDFILKSGRLHSALKTVALCMTSFLEAFQKLADMATGTRGSTREIGSALTRLCLRHRSIEGKLKGLSNAITDSMVAPLQERIEEWRRSVAGLDRDHAKESKRAHQDLKRASLEAVRQQKKLKKGKMETSEQLEHAVQEVNDKLLLLREFEKSSVKASLIEERSRLCLFISCLKPVMDEELAMLTEVTHLQEIVHSLCMVADSPEALSTSSEQVISDLIGTKTQAPLPPATPGTSSSEGSLPSAAGSLSHSPAHHATYSRSLSQSNPAAGSLSLSLTKDVPDALQPSFGKSSAGDSHSTAVASSTMASEHRRLSAMAEGAAFDIESQQQRAPLVMRARDPSGHSAHFDRPHTISTAYERSSSRPTITSETYMAPDLCRPPSLQPHQHHRPASSYAGNAGSLSRGDDNPYAVPCVIPKRRPTQSGDVKVADIYARPSLVSGTGYRTPNIRPLPVATPTVPEFGTGQQPAIPVAGYVNMNQLAHLALQHQQELSQKKEPTESSDEKTDDDENVNQTFSLSSAKQNQASKVRQEPRPNALEIDPDAEIDGYHTYGTWSTSQKRETGSSHDPAVTFPGSGINLHALADRLARACRLESIDKYCTLPRQRHAGDLRLSSSSAGIAALYSGKLRDKDVAFSRMSSTPLGLSLSEMPPPAMATPPRSRGAERGAILRAAQYASPASPWSSDPDSPVFN